jgi:hypothetical protein
MSNGFFPKNFWGGGIALPGKKLILYEWLDLTSTVSRRDAKNDPY